MKKIGFNRGKFLKYAIDDYSTPDQWYELGCELQYDFVVSFGEGVPTSEYEGIMAGILDVFFDTFDLNLERLGYNTWMDDGRLKALFGLTNSYPIETKDRHPKNILLGKGFMFSVRVYWDKGSFDLRLLKKLENSLNAFCKIKQTHLILTKMIIIPRSKETMAAKIKANKERPHNIN